MVTALALDPPPPAARLSGFTALTALEVIVSEERIPAPILELGRESWFVGLPLLSSDFCGSVGLAWFSWWLIGSPADTCAGVPG